MENENDMAECSLNMSNGELCEADQTLPDGNANYNVNNCGNYDIFKCATGTHCYMYYLNTGYGCDTDIVFCSTNIDIVDIVNFVRNMIIPTNYLCSLLLSGCGLLSPSSGSLCADVANCFCTGDICLTGGDNCKSGNVLLGGSPVCDDSWDLTDAGVLCRQIGFSGASEATKNSR
jgi:hypothetical protein